VSVTEAVDALESLTQPGSLGLIQRVTAADALDDGHELASGQRGCVVAAGITTGVGGSTGHSTGRRRCAE
jgi:hypothetical protein